MTIFSDGFESGDFTAWTATGGSGTHAESVVHTNPHHGLHNAQFDCTDLNNESWTYKDFADANICYARKYIKFVSGLPPVAGNRIYLTQVDHDDYGSMVGAIVEKTATGVRWGTSTIIGYAETFNYEVGESNPATGTWYCIEVCRDVTNGRTLLYVDGVKLVDVAKAHVGGSNQCYVGMTRKDTNTQSVIAVDCVVVADAYIGPEVPPPPPAAGVAGGGGFFLDTRYIADRIIEKAAKTAIVYGLNWLVSIVLDEDS